MFVRLFLVILLFFSGLGTVGAEQRLQNLWDAIEIYAAVLTGL